MATSKKTDKFIKELGYQVFLIIGAVDIGIALAISPTNVMHLIGGLLSIIIAVFFKLELP